MLDKISDAGLLKFSAASYAGFGALAIAAPSASHEFHATDKAGPKNDLLMRYAGVPLVMFSAQTMGAAGGSSKAQKTALKVVGFGAAANVAIDLFATQRGYFKKDIVVAESLALGALSALCLIKGFQKPKEAAANEQKSSAVEAPKSKK